MISGMPFGHRDNLLYLMKLFFMVVTIWLVITLKLFFLIDGDNMIYHSKDGIQVSYDLYGVKSYQLFEDRNASHIRKHN